MCVLYVQQQPHLLVPLDDKGAELLGDADTLVRLPTPPFHLLLDLYLPLSVLVSQKRMCLFYIASQRIYDAEQLIFCQHVPFLSHSFAAYGRGVGFRVLAESLALRLDAVVNIVGGFKIGGKLCPSFAGAFREKPPVFERRHLFTKFLDFCLVRQNF
jgi:hypothetical protein